MTTNSEYLFFRGITDAQKRVRGLARGNQGIVRQLNGLRFRKLTIQPLDLNDEEHRKLYELKNPREVLS